MHSNAVVYCCMHAGIEDHLHSAYNIYTGYSQGAEEAGGGLGVVPAVHGF